MTALAPTGSGKTISYLLPLLTLLRRPSSSLSLESKAKLSSSLASKPLAKSFTSPRALIVSPTRELALQIQNECAKLTKGRKWRIVVLSKANEDSVVAGGVGESFILFFKTGNATGPRLPWGVGSESDVIHIFIFWGALLSRYFNCHSSKVDPGC